MKITISAADANALHKALKDIYEQARKHEYEKYRFIGLRSDGENVTAFACDGIRIIEKTVLALHPSDECTIYTPLPERQKNVVDFVQFDSEVIKMEYNIPDVELFDSSRYFEDLNDFEYEFAVNPVLLSGLLKSYSSKEAKFHVQNPLKPIIITSKYDSSERGLIMPCRLKGHNE